MITIRNRIFNLSDIDQGIYKHAIQIKTGVFSLFKKIIQGNGKKIQFLCIEYYIMHTKKVNLHAKFFLSENVCLSTKIDLQFKKIKNFGSISILLENFF